jgi:hypothetical protein
LHAAGRDGILPVITSSKISTLPYCVHSARIAGKKSGKGSTRPMFPTYGSTMTAAISSPCASKAARNAAVSL